MKTQEMPCHKLTGVFYCDMIEKRLCKAGKGDKR